MVIAEPYGMTELHEFLSTNGIKMSIVVYPWPMQLLDGKKITEARKWADFVKSDVSNI